MEPVYSLIICHYSYVPFFYPFPPGLVLSLVLSGWFLSESTPTPQPPISPLPPPCSTSQHTTLGSSVHLKVARFLLSLLQPQVYSPPPSVPRYHPYVLVVPSATPIISCSSVPPLYCPFSTIIASACLPLIACLDPPGLYRPNP